MKKLFTVSAAALFFLLTASSFAQKAGVHFGGGMANYLGDLRQQDFSVVQAQPIGSFGVFITDGNRLTLRADFSTTRLKAEDRVTQNKWLRKRNLSFQSNLTETGVMLEYNFRSRGEDHERKVIPYGLIGGSYFHFNPYAITQEGNKVNLRDLGTEGQGLSDYPDKALYKLNQFAIPYGGGIKYYISDYVWVGAELIYRKLFTDYLDDISGFYADPKILAAKRGQLSADLAYRGDELKPAGTFPGTGVQRGNGKLNDSFYFLQVKLYISIPGIFGIDDGGISGGGRSSRSARARMHCPKY